MKENYFICYSYLFKAKQSHPVWQAGNLRVPTDFAVFAVPGVRESWPSVQECFLMATKFCRACTQVKPNIHSHPMTISLNDSQARWWQLGQGLSFSFKTSNFEHMIVANNPNSFLFNESTYQWQHQRCGGKGVWVKGGYWPIAGPYGLGKPDSRKRQLSQYLH